MEVLGTRLNVEAQPSETRLSVNKGRVRLTRLIDGSVADLGANQQVVATADRSQTLSPSPRPVPVNSWQSDLRASMGRWLPPDDRLAARLRALPIIINRSKEGPLALYVAGFGVAHWGSSPVRLEARSRFRFRGRMRSSQALYFGVTTRKPDGSFGGKFEVALPAPAGLDADGAFEADVELDDLHLQLAPRFGSPVGFELLDCYVCTVEVDAGLEIFQVELLPDSIKRA